MPLTKAQCPNCGGALEVDASKEAAVCPFCNTPYIVEKAINNYTTNITNNIQADTVVIQDCGDLEFEVSNTTLIRYLGHEENVVLPDYIDSIADHAFSGCSFIRSIQFNHGLQRIGSMAFENCFHLSDVFFPATLITVADTAFTGCIGLKRIHVADLYMWCYCTSSGGPGTSHYVSKKHAGINNPSLVSLCFGGNEIKDLVLPKGLNTIKENAFAAFNLTSVVIPDGVTTIGSAAFANCLELKSVSIPKSVNRICISAFFNCKNLEFVEFDPEGVSIEPNAFKGTPFATKFVSNEKRSDKKSGCYVATCVYGSYDCPEVWTLRRYRDDTLASTRRGRAFIHTYYAVSPTLVKWFGKTKWFKKMWQGKLDRMVKRLNESGVENTPYQDRIW